MGVERAQEGPRRKDYVRPTIEVLGDLTDLTQGSGGPGHDSIGCVPGIGS